MSESIAPGEALEPGVSVHDSFLDKVIGHYRIVEHIGDGAYGTVYRVEHIHLGVSYAAKILHPTFARQEKSLKRFWREAQTTGRLKHENIVSVSDFAVDPKLGPYLIMEYLEGETLGDRLERMGSLSLEQVRDVAKPICLALTAAHTLGVIHRDLKPDNIFISTVNGVEHVKVLDFGIARLTEGGESLTGVGQTLGTPEYMSPEQCRGMSLTPAADVYCFGILLYQMLTGELPFPGQDPHQFMVHHLLTPPPELDESFPAPLRLLMSQLLQKKPEERPSTMEGVWRSLRKVLPRALKSTFPDDELRYQELFPDGLPGEEPVAPTNATLSFGADGIEAAATSAGGDATDTELEAVGTLPGEEAVPEDDDVILLVRKKDDEKTPTMEVEALPEYDDAYDDSATQIELDAVDLDASDDDVDASASLVLSPSVEINAAFSSGSPVSGVPAVPATSGSPVASVTEAKVSFHVEIEVEDERVFAERFVSDLEKGSLFLHPDHPFQIGDAFFFRFSLPDKRTLLCGWGEVSQVVFEGMGEHPGVQVRLNEFDPASRKVLKKLLQRAGSR